MEKYLHYNAGDFAGEPSFIEWAKGDSAGSDIDWDKWLADHPEKTQEINQARFLVKNINFKIENISQSKKDQIWKNIDTNTAKETDAPRKSIVRKLMYAVAAVLVGIIVMVNLPSGATTITTQYADSQQIQLPDGSTVKLNANSEISYNEESWETERLLELVGEAFFEVQRGSTFSVVTDHGSIQVLGTSFNVFARSGILDVTCKTGKVSVKSGDKETILTPDQKVTVTKGKHVYNKAVDESVDRSNWRSGIYAYNAADLSEVVDELERQLDLDITLKSEMAELKYTGSFDKNNAHEALAEVFWPLGLEYLLDGRKAIISVKQ